MPAAAEAAAEGQHANHMGPPRRLPTGAVLARAAEAARGGPEENDDGPTEPQPWGPGRAPPSRQGNTRDPATWITQQEGGRGWSEPFRGGSPWVTDLRGDPR